jgi:hypothetical protein
MSSNGPFLTTTSTSSTPIIGVSGLNNPLCIPADSTDANPQTTPLPNNPLTLPQTTSPGPHSSTPLPQQQVTQLTSNSHDRSKPNMVLPQQRLPLLFSTSNSLTTTLPANLIPTPHTFFTANSPSINLIGNGSNNHTNPTPLTQPMDHNSRQTRLPINPPQLLIKPSSTDVNSQNGPSAQSFLLPHLSKNPPSSLQTIPLLNRNNKVIPQPSARALPQTALPTLTNVNGQENNSSEIDFSENNSNTLPVVKLVNTTSMTNQTNPMIIPLSTTHTNNTPGLSKEVLSGSGIIPNSSSNNSIKGHNSLPNNLNNDSISNNNSINGGFNSLGNNVPTNPILLLSNPPPSASSSMRRSNNTDNGNNKQLRALVTNPLTSTTNHKQYQQSQLTSQQQYTTQNPFGSRLLQNKLSLDSFHNQVKPGQTTSSPIQEVRSMGSMGSMAGNFLYKPRQTTANGSNTKANPFSLTSPTNMLSMQFQSNSSTCANMGLQSDINQFKPFDNQQIDNGSNSSIHLDSLKNGSTRHLNSNMGMFGIDALTSPNTAFLPGKKRKTPTDGFGRFGEDNNDSINSPHYSRGYNTSTYSSYGLNMHNVHHLHHVDGNGKTKNPHMMQDLMGNPSNFMYSDENDKDGDGGSNDGDVGDEFLDPYGHSATDVGKRANRNMIDGYVDQQGEQNLGGGRGRKSADGRKRAKENPPGKNNAQLQSQQQQQQQQQGPRVQRRNGNNHIDPIGGVNNIPKKKKAPVVIPPKSARQLAKYEQSQRDVSGDSGNISAYNSSANNISHRSGGGGIGLHNNISGEKHGLVLNSHGTGVIQYDEPPTVEELQNQLQSLLPKQIQHLQQFDYFRPLYTYQYPLQFGGLAFLCPPSKSFHVIKELPFDEQLSFMQSFRKQVEDMIEEARRHTEDAVLAIGNSFLIDRQELVDRNYKPSPNVILDKGPNFVTLSKENSEKIAELSNNNTTAEIVDPHKLPKIDENQLTKTTQQPQSPSPHSTISVIPTPTITTEALKISPTLPTNPSNPTSSLPNDSNSTTPLSSLTPLPEHLPGTASSYQSSPPVPLQPKYTPLSQLTPDNPMLAPYLTTADLDITYNPNHPVLLHVLLAQPSQGRCPAHLAAAYPFTPPPHFRHKQLLLERQWILDQLEYLKWYGRLDLYFLEQSGTIASVNNNNTNTVKEKDRRAAQQHMSSLPEGFNPHFDPNNPNSFPQPINAASIHLDRYRRQLNNENTDEPKYAFPYTPPGSNAPTILTDKNLVQGMLPIQFSSHKVLPLTICNIPSGKYAGLNGDEILAAMNMTPDEGRKMLLFSDLETMFIILKHKEYQYLRLLKQRKLEFQSMVIIDTVINNITIQHFINVKFYKAFFNKNISGHYGSLPQIGPSSTESSFPSQGTASFHITNNLSTNTSHPSSNNNNIFNISLPLSEPKTLNNASSCVPIIAPMNCLHSSFSITHGINHIPNSSNDHTKFPLPVFPTTMTSNQTPTTSKSKSTQLTITGNSSSGDDGKNINQTLATPPAQTVANTADIDASLNYTDPITLIHYTPAAWGNTPRRYPLLSQVGDNQKSLKLFQTSLQAPSPLPSTHVLPIEAKQVLQNQQSSNILFSGQALLGKQTSTTASHLPSSLFPQTLTTTSTLIAPTLHPNSSVDGINGSSHGTGNGSTGNGSSSSSSSNSGNLSTAGSTDPDDPINSFYSQHLPLNMNPISLDFNSRTSCLSCCAKVSSYWREPWKGIRLCNSCALRYKKICVSCVSCLHIPYCNELKKSPSICLKCSGLLLHYED